MYKESIFRRKISSVIMILLTSVVLLYIAQLLNNFIVYGFKVSNFTGVLFTLAVLLVTLIEIQKCKISYTYSIIANQFIIHKIKGNIDKVVENIKIDDIKYIGKIRSCNFSKEVAFGGTHTCSLFNKDLYCCVYEDRDKIKKFNFESSERLVEKVNKLREKRLAS
ncbi:hypothetical protein [Clostridium sp. JN-9]|uniref:hypothetical protein n=1 Tax=Clostridium sp. JN-9 TaxID=2507159 RepID=UPI000FFE1A60|nr:hypothetical protein [Clostridium sp. JN-9]QAT38854.1 hypothetical protein EQM05_00450 [Clostridium sp. JN-9]